MPQENWKVIRLGGKPIHVVLNEFRDHLRLDVREHYQLIDGDTAPTKKGVNLLFADADALVTAITSVIGDDIERVKVNADLRNPIFVSIAQFRGQERLDVRHHYNADSEWKPTKKGISIPLGDSAVLLKAIVAVAGSEE